MYVDGACSCLKVQDCRWPLEFPSTTACPCCLILIATCFFCLLLLVGTAWDCLLLLAITRFCLLPLRLSAQDWVACRAESSTPKIHTGVRRFQIVLVDQKIRRAQQVSDRRHWWIRPNELANQAFAHVAHRYAIFLCSLDSQRSVQRVGQLASAHVSLWSVRGLSVQVSSKNNLHM